MNSQDYYNWLKRFDKRTTSDDTFTPPAVYDVVRDYVHHQIIRLDELNVVRPFYPDGDYTDLSQYDENSMVIDNPPFSIISQICQFYQDNGIKFFLFAPALTLFSTSRNIGGLTHLVAPVDITYDNGASVKTAFIHNLTPHIKVKTCPTLYRALRATQAIPQALPKYQYPAHVLMVSQLNALCACGFDFEVLFN